MKTFVPHPYQTLLIKHALDTPRCALWAGMGMGKTSSTIDIIDTCMLAERIPRALVIAPKRVALSTWPDEVKKWEQFSHLKIQPILGTTAERKDALRNDKAGIYTINYDNIPWLVSQLNGQPWPFPMVVPDESTRLKSFRLEQGGKRAHALFDAIDRKTRRWINLTGLAAPNGLQDLWGQTYFLDKGFRLGRSYSAFENRWFGFQRATDALNHHKTHVKRVVFPHAQAEIQGLLKDICLALDPKDWFDLEEPIVRDVYVDLPPHARKHYREMEREMFTAFKSKGVGDTDSEHSFEVEAFSAASKSIKCLQIAAGAAFVEGSTKKWVNVHDEKLDALGSIIEEAAGAPVLVSYHFRPDLARIRDRFPWARALDANPQTIVDWNAGRIPLLVAHPQSAGHGLNLQDGGNILVYFSSWWALEQHAQILERIGPMRQKQAGHDRPVWVYRIIARDTVDELVIDRLSTKRSVSDILTEAMKRRNL
jgi:SNF2 family DNA or RNA helicase